MQLWDVSGECTHATWSFIKQRLYSAINCLWPCTWYSQHPQCGLLVCLAPPDGSKHYSNGQHSLYSPPTYSIILCLHIWCTTIIKLKMKTLFKSWELFILYIHRTEDLWEWQTPIVPLKMYRTCLNVIFDSEVKMFSDLPLVKAIWLIIATIIVYVWSMQVLMIDKPKQLYLVLLIPILDVTVCTHGLTVSWSVL